jgi:hypothetical protein
MRSARPPEAPRVLHPSGLAQLLPPVLSLLLFALHSGCGPSQSADAYLTYNAQSSHFRVAIAAEGTVEAVRSHVLSVPRIRYQPEITYLAPEGTSASQGDVIVQFKCRQLEVANLKARTDLQLAEAEARTKEAELGMQQALYQAQLKQSEVSAEVSRLQVSRLKFVAPKVRAIEELRLKKAELKAKQLRQKLAGLEAIHKEERTHRQLKIQQADRQLKQTQKHLDGLEMTAPADGFVLHERSWMTGNKVQEGDAVYPGMPVAKVPDMSALHAKLQVDEIRAQKLKKGQRAVLSVTSLGARGLPGKVVTVAKRAVPVKRNSKVKQVEVTVSIDTTLSGLVPGLTVRAEIIVDELENAIALPRECLFQMDSLRVVYVKAGGRFEMRAVSVQKQSTDFVVLGGEVEAGEEIALREPVAELVRK